MTSSKLCIFVSLEQTVGHVLDDGLCRPHLESQGWTLEEWAWTQEHPWESADLLVFRSCYDYWERLDDFLLFLTRIESLGIPVHNALSLVRWNMDKQYLFQLEKAGIPVLKSHLITPQTSRIELESLVHHYSPRQEFVLKPCIGAGGFEMWRLQASQLKDVQVAKPHLLQPFCDSVLQGELSVMLFSGRVSHAVKKMAKDGEYRVQDSHGGTTVSVDLRQEPALLKASAKVADVIAELGLPQPLYARYDFLRGSEPDELLLMEVELIEPTLFLQHDPGAAERFTACLLQAFADSSHFRKGERG